MRSSGYYYEVVAVAVGFYCPYFHVEVLPETADYVVERDCLRNILCVRVDEEVSQGRPLG